jgi:hypothetical protein
MSDLDETVKQRLFSDNVLSFLGLQASDYVRATPYDHGTDEGYYE